MSSASSSLEPAEPRRPDRHLGAGKIGCGHIAAMFAEAGWRVSSPRARPTVVERIAPAGGFACVVGRRRAGASRAEAVAPRRRGVRAGGGRAPTSRDRGGRAQRARARRGAGPWPGRAARRPAGRRLGRGERRRRARAWRTAVQRGRRPRGPRAAPARGRGRDRLARGHRRRLEDLRPPGVHRRRVPLAGRRPRPRSAGRSPTSRAIEETDDYAEDLMAQVPRLRRRARDVRLPRHAARPRRTSTRRSPTRCCAR